MYRQGDLLIVQVKAIPSTATKTDDPVLVRGEATGHSHRVQGQIQVFRDADKIYLRGAGQLVHEEHAPISLEEDVYQVVRQREYNPQANRVVQD